MTHNRVVITDAELKGEFANTRCAGQFGDIVERRARNIEKEGVERLVGSRSADRLRSYRDVAPARTSALRTHLPRSQNSQSG